MAFINTFSPRSLTAPSRTTIRCQLSDRPPPTRSPEDVLASTLQSLMDSNGVLARLQQGGTEAAEAAQTAFATALASLGVSADVPDGDDVYDVNIPTEPPFDPVQACVLAGYAFRAYEDPQPGCYREVHETIVQTPDPDTTDNVIVAEYAYPNADAIARTAVGVFQLSLTALDDDAPRLFVAARLGVTVRVNALSERNFSLLRKPPVSATNENADDLVLLAYESESAYNSGDPPLLRGCLSLVDIVARADAAKAPIEDGPFEVSLSVVGEDVVMRNFFSASRIPPNLRLPFMHVERLAGDLISAATVKKAQISLNITYVPFDMQAPDGSAVDEAEVAADYIEEVENEEEATNIYGAGSTLQEALREKLPPGQMPLPANWKKLAKGVRELAAEIDDATPGRTRQAVREDIPQALFVESHITDTEVWLFHDADAKDLIVAFRGTEQVSWQDFVTDAQLFLQRWDPGGDIDLELSKSTTVGLSVLMSAAGIIGGDSDEESAAGEEGEEDPIADDASCVHYGFLRAYHAVREAVLCAIESVAGDDLSGHRLYFVGHSLGGALATLCAADFAALNPWAAANIVCLSYGAPKAGNAGFARQYNELVRNSFRIVNDSDVVVRMPKSIGARPCERYQHVGRTVLVNEVGELWVEGDDGENSGEVEGDGARYRQSVMDPFRERYTDARKLLEYEQEMWRQLVSGRSLRHHMVGLRGRCEKAGFGIY